MKTLNFLVWRSVRVLSVLFFFMIPYIAVAADRLAFFQRGYITNGGELLVPLLCYGAMYLLFKLEDYLHKSLKEQSYENKTKRQTVL